MHVAPESGCTHSMMRPVADHDQPPWTMQTRMPLWNHCDVVAFRCRHQQPITTVHSARGRRHCSVPVVQLRDGADRTRQTPNNPSRISLFFPQSPPPWSGNAAECLLACAVAVALAKSRVSPYMFISLASASGRRPFSARELQLAVKRGARRAATSSTAAAAGWSVRGPLPTVP